ncbi:MAG: zf-HC2 domain-containing protein [Clostridia bacterium]|nr:zf-HC2 domain-containing protein [Clostridia bacterium]
MKEVCKHNIENINLLIDNMLDNEERVRLSSHISTCSSCSSYYHDMLTLKKNISGNKLTLPIDFASKTMEKINNQKKSKIAVITTHRFFKLAVSAAAACFVIAFAIVFLNQNMFANKTSESALLGSSEKSMANEMQIDAPVPAPEYEGSAEKRSQDNQLTMMTVESSCESIDEYNYLLNNVSLRTDDIINILTDEFHITDYQLTDDCLVFNTDTETYAKVLEKLDLEVIEEHISEDNNVIVKIVNNNGG